MMSGNIGEGLFKGLIIIGLIFGLLIWGGFELIEWAFFDDAIRVHQPIQPELEIKVKDNVIDTTYIYRKP